MSNHEKSFDLNTLLIAEKIILEKNMSGDFGVSLPQALNYSKMPTIAPKVLLPPPPTIEELLEPVLLPPAPIYQARPVSTTKTTGRELLDHNRVHPSDNQVVSKKLGNSLASDTNQQQNKKKRYVIGSIILLGIIVILLIIIILALFLNKTSSESKNLNFLLIKYF